MNPHFWGRMSDEYLKDHPEPPAITDEVLAVFEKSVDLKLPKALTDLLRVKNGGPLQNPDFRFNGKDYQVAFIKAALPDHAYDSMQTYSSILSNPDADAARKQLEKKVGDLSKLYLWLNPMENPMLLR